MQGRNAPLRKNASENSISDSGEKFNEKFSMKEDSDFEYDEDSNLTREQQRQVSTPEFKRWFGDSKVVDENGEPKVFYHATDADFTVFDREKLGQYTSENTDNEAAIESAKVGFWFSENDLWEKTGNKKTMEVYSPFLLLQNPVKIRSHIPAPKGLPSDPPA